MLLAGLGIITCCGILIKMLGKMVMKLFFSHHKRTGEFELMYGVNRSTPDTSTTLHWAFAYPTSITGIQTIILQAIERAGQSYNDLPGKL